MKPHIYKLAGAQNWICTGQGWFMNGKTPSDALRRWHKTKKE